MATTTDITSTDSSAHDGMAVLHGYDPETGQVSTDVFRERDEHTSIASPWHRAQALRESVEDDFPAWIFSVGQDQRSHFLMYRFNMERLGLGDGTDTYEDWLREHGKTPATPA